MNFDELLLNTLDLTEDSSTDVDYTHHLLFLQPIQSLSDPIHLHFSKHFFTVLDYSDLQ
jgi:hypothetical protein